MYPFVRMAKDIWKARKAPHLDLDDVHVSHHICWPHDLDFMLELNNGRTLTLMDLGRIPMAYRSGLVDVLKDNGWGLTVAGNTLRYRRRIRVFDRIELRTRMLGWDHRFVYIEQAMWRSDGECANHALFRTAVTSPQGIVAPGKVAEALGHDPQSPALPGWVTAWIDGDAHRPWPPEQRDVVFADAA